MEYDGLITKPTLDELYHHGIKGQKWGVQNGPPYPLDSKVSTGKSLRKSKTSGKKVFVSGSSKTQDKESNYYYKKLPKGVREELDQRMKNKDIIIVGDAPGIDRQVQDYLKKKHYKNVEVYSPGDEPRYLKNKKWKNNLIDSSEFEPGSKEWLAKKDKIMSEVADEGIAVILPEGSNATRNNVRRLLDSNKDVSVYQLMDSRYHNYKDGAYKTVGVKAMSLSDDPKKDFPDLKGVKDPENYFDQPASNRKNIREYYELRNHIAAKSGDWYEGKAVSNGFKANREKANKIGEEMWRLSNKMFINKGNGRGLEKAPNYDELSAKYDKLVAQSKGLDEDLLGIVLKDIGYEDTEFNRKFIRNVVFYD